jgi:hypothetical protein
LYAERGGTSLRDRGSFGNQGATRLNVAIQELTVQMFKACSSHDSLNDEP